MLHHRVDLVTRSSAEHDIITRLCRRSPDDATVNKMQNLWSLETHFHCVVTQCRIGGGFLDVRTSVPAPGGECINGIADIQAWRNQISQDPQLSEANSFAVSADTYASLLVLSTVLYVRQSRKPKPDYKTTRKGPKRIGTDGSDGNRLYLGKAKKNGGNAVIQSIVCLFIHSA